MKAAKPLSGKAYGSIPHLPESKFGNRDDKGVDAKLAPYFLQKPPGEWDEIIVTEKLDGSCVSVANVDGEIVALTRSGYPAISSPFEQHRHFDRWVQTYRDRFMWMNPGERICGEWLMQAHGTKYNIEPDGVIVFFDFFIDDCRMPYKILQKVCKYGELIPAFVVVHGSKGTDSLFPRGVSIAEAMDAMGEHGFHGATGLAEGCVWRWERPNRYHEYDSIKRPVVMAKYVRPEKNPGCYLGHYEGDKWIEHEPVWNVEPKELFK